MLVLGSAIVWSFGGTLARFLAIDDGWTIVFWRSLFAALFLIGFMLLRDGPRGTVTLFRNMGLPGVAVGLCFATASTSFILALAYTTVANVVLIQAGVPLIAALDQLDRLSRAYLAPDLACDYRRHRRRRHHGIGFRERRGLAGRRCACVLIAFVFALATVITRRYAHVRMTPAACFGTIVAGTVAAIMSSGLAVTASELGVLVDLRRPQFRPWACTVRHRCAAGSFCSCRPARHRRNGAGAALGRGHPRRDPERQHHRWRHGRARGPSCLSQCRNAGGSDARPVETSWAGRWRKSQVS